MIVGQNFSNAVKTAATKTPAAGFTGVAPTQGGYLPIAKQARDPYGTVVAPQVGPFPKGFATDGGGSTIAGAPYGPPIYNDNGSPSAAQYAASIMVGKDYTPDYSSLINDDPSLVAYRNNEGPALAAAAAQRAAAIQQDALQYGGSSLPAGVKDQFGDLTPTVLQQAASNPYSDQAVAARNNDQATLQMKQALAARGALQSGDLNYGQDQLSTQYGQTQYNNGQSFANSFNNAVQGYLSTVQQQKSGEANAISQAEQNVYSQPGNQPTTQSSANLVQNWQQLYGKPVYQGIDGTLYNPDGSTY